MFYYVSITVTPAANPRTLFQAYTSTNQQAKIHGIDIGMEGGTPASSPILFDWCVQSSAGDGLPATAFLQDRTSSITVQTTLQKTFTAEPTLDSTIINFSLHQQGTAFWRPPFPIILKDSERIGLRYLSSTFVSVALTVYMEE